MMGRQRLSADLEAALGNAAQQLGTSELSRHLDVAASSLTRRKMLIARGYVTAEAGQSAYAPPAELVAPLVCHWGDGVRREYPPWDPRHPGRPPRLTLERVSEGWMLVVSPAPTALDIARMGERLSYTYSVRQVIAEQASETTVPQTSRDLLIMRAMVSALESIAAAGTVARVQLNRSGSPAPTSATPAAISSELWARFEQEVRR